MLPTTTKIAFDNIIDCITCADGGSNLVKLKMMIESLDERATSGDKDADEILLIVQRFSRLITLANKN